MEGNKYLNARHYTFLESIFPFLIDILYLINIHAACQKGYTGKNCETVCVYPSYGLDCQSFCTCIANQCDHANGCIRQLKGTSLFLCLNLRFSLRSWNYFLLYIKQI